MKKNTITVKIGGMHCAHCSARVEAAFKAAGASGIKVDFKKGSAKIEATESFSTDKIKSLVEATGFEFLGIE